MKSWIKGGLIGGAIITAIYLFSILMTLLNLGDVFVIDRLVGLFMFLLRIYDVLVFSPIYLLLIYTYIITIIILLFKKETQIKKIIKYFVIVFSIIFVLLYLIPRLFGGPEFLWDILHLFWNVPSLCCPPGHLQDSFLGWVLALLINIIFYSTIGAIIGGVVGNVRIKRSSPASGQQIKTN
tara:strand:+ start:5672 stop:6214 length:543 start_codon:yes stop_codon:yes gene_type:complete